MKIATWNVSSGIDMSNYSGELFNKNPEISVDDRCLIEIARAIKINDIDIIALQEVTTTESFKFLEKLTDLTSLKYIAKFENSPGFLIKNTKMGVAILSKFPISVNEKQLFSNPNLKKETKNGLYTTHDKGFLAVEINAPEKLNLISTQFLPYHRFDANIFDYKHIFTNFQNYSTKNNCLICGDFNVISGKSDLMKLLDKIAITHNFVFDDVTTTDDKKVDNIILPKSIIVKNAYIEKKIAPSDHFLCVVEI